MDERAVITTVLYVLPYGRARQNLPLSFGGNMLAP
ncbi:hypothetical protein FrEUN1fDRAFT_3390 [Parafrankia sp. EUN1f]|nr:hypothetical protein FrEUN1fDRAFT_3390 [Parafrankia sp. EUN1f]